MINRNHGQGGEEGRVRAREGRQVVADVCGAPVTVLQQDEGAGFGAALQALAALEEETDLQALTDHHLLRNEALCCEPGTSAVNFYNEAYARYLEAVDAIKPLYT